MKPQDFIDKWLGWAKNKEEINDEILADLNKMNQALIIDGVVQQSEPLIDIHGYVGELNGNCRKCGLPEGCHEL